MTRLETHIIDVLEHAPTNRPTKRQPIDQVAMGAGEFSVAEFDDGHESLHEAGVVRLRNFSAPEYDVNGKSLGGCPEVGPNA